jgi:hypothetical protein
MSEVKIIPTIEQLTALARAKTVDVLKDMDIYKVMSVNEQKDIYLNMVQENLNKEKKKYGFSESMATDSGKDMGYKGYDPAFGKDTQAFTDLVESVDFPKFVKDLLKGVFDANLSVMKAQTDSYIKLMKEATKSSADFIKKVKDDESFAKLAEKAGGKYNVITEKQADGSTKLQLTDSNGDKVDTEDTEVKKAIMETKIEMAKEHRAALREVLLMGVTRLVVEKGEIDAAVEFSVKATRNSTAHHDDQNINVNTIEGGYGGGLIGDIFGGPSGSFSNTNTNIQVNTSDKKATDDLSATLKGHVNIKFKTDYFKLDNFANMYADGGVAALKPAAAPGIPGAVPGR